MASFAEKLHDVANGARISPSSLVFLSDLSSEDRTTFMSFWPGLSRDRRHEIITSLTTMAEDNIELDFRHVFMTALEDSDPAVRVSAIDGLFEDESPALLRKLLSLVRTDEQAEVREAAALALSRFTLLAHCAKLGDRATELRAVLIESATNVHEEVAVRRRAIEALGYFHDDEDVQELVQQAYLAGGKQAESAVFAMGRSMDDRWKATVVKELHSSIPAMRYEAAHAAGEMALPGTVPRLIELVDDSDLQVRLAVVWALGQIGGKPATQALIRVLQESDPAIREAAQEALDEIAFAANPLNVLG